MAVHDRLGHAGGARRVDHPQRVVERHLGEFQRTRRGHGFRPRHRLRKLRNVDGFIKIGNQQQLLDRRQVREDFAHDIAAVEVTAAIAVTVDRQHHARLDLAEAVDHRHMPHVGRGGRPDRADAGYRQQRDDRLRNVGHVGDHAVAGLDAQVLERVGQGRDLALEFVPRHFGAGAQLGFENDRRPVAHRMAQAMLGVIQMRAFEPDRARHLALLEHLLVRHRGLDFVVFPDAGPERLKLIDRPLPQCVVVGKLQATCLLKPCHVGGQAGVLEALRRGLPQQGAFGDACHVVVSSTCRVQCFWLCSSLVSGFYPERRGPGGFVRATHGIGC